MLSIAEGTDGYDEYFGIEKTNFGRGTLIIRHTDYQNHAGEPHIYTDYLGAVTQGAAIEVKLCEDGDYEVALDYEIRENNFDISGWNPLPTYHNYRIFFRFSVRNGNCMIYPFEYETNRELTNSSFAGHEPTGVCKPRRLNVVTVTEDERQNTTVPESWYVLEQSNIDSIVIWQDSNSTVYQTSPNRNPKILCASLTEYLVVVTFRL